jgi:hypothetical protein
LKIPHDKSTPTWNGSTPRHPSPHLELAIKGGPHLTPVPGADEHGLLARVASQRWEQSSRTPSSARASGFAVVDVMMRSILVSATPCWPPFPALPDSSAVW